VALPPFLGLNEGNFKMEFITFLVDENLTWNLTWQIWILSFRSAEEFFGTIL